MALLVRVRPGALKYSDVRMENTYILLFSRLHGKFEKGYDSLAVGVNSRNGEMHVLEGLRDQIPLCGTDLS